MMFSFKTRILLLVTAVIVILSGISIFLLIIDQNTHLEDSFIARGETLVTLLSKIASEGLAVEKIDLINKASYIIHTEDVTTIMVYTDLWDIFESYPAGKYNKPGDLALAQRHFDQSEAPFYTKGQDIYRFWAKVLYQPYNDVKALTVGYVSIEISSERLRKTINKNILYNTLAGVFIVFTALFSLNLLINSLVLKPLADLHRSVRALKMGEFPESMPQQSTDEIGMLSREFYEMSVALKDREEALREKTAYLDSIFKSSHFALVAMDKDLRTKYFNTMAEKVFDYKANDILGKGLLEIDQDYISLERLQHAIKAVKSKGIYKFETSFKKGYKTITLDACIFGIKDKDDNLLGFVFTGIDITQKKKTETWLTTQYTIMRILVESLSLKEVIIRVLGTVCFNMGWQYGEMWIVDKDSERLRFVEKWSESEGYLNTFKSLSKDITFARGEGLPGRVWESGKPEFIHNLAGDSNFMRKEAAEAACLNCGFAFPIKSDKNFLGVMSFFSKDIYELTDDTKEMFEFLGNQIGNHMERMEAEKRLKEYSEELQRSNKELEQFAYVTSHDLQQPLRVITGFVQLLERRYKDKLDHEASEFIDFIVQGTERMQLLINDLLAYSRVTTRQKPLKPVDMNQAVKTATMNLMRTIEESGATIIYDKLPVVNADETQMIQLFQNLLDNAIKYRGDEIPHIEISAKQADGGWLFSVSDNGIGFDTEQAGRIFEVFQRLHTDSKYKGTGIGLAICKKIVERHGGRIWAESQVGKGSVFYFTMSR